MFYLKTICVSILIAFLAILILKWKNFRQEPKFEVSFRTVSKKSDVTGPWSVKHRNFAVYAVRGHRAYMEDRFGIIDVTDDTGDNLLWLFGIFDGHGGSFICEYAERYLLRSIRNQIIKSSPDLLNITKILIDEFHQIDEAAIREAGLKRHLCGSTALVGVHHKRKLYVANLGDTRAVAKKAAKRDLFETIDHKPNMPDESARIKAAGGSVRFNGVWRVGGILAVSRALGDSMLKQRGWLIATPDIYVIDFERMPLDYVIMASDGLWDVFTSREAIDFIKPHINEYYLGAKKLAKEALKKGTQDNVCVMVITFRNEFDQPLYNSIYE